LFYKKTPKKNRHKNPDKRRIRSANELFSYTWRNKNLMCSHIPLDYSGSLRDLCATHRS
jgi:hypothetical protein